MILNTSTTYHRVTLPHPPPTLRRRDLYTQRGEQQEWCWRVKFVDSAGQGSAEVALSPKPWALELFQSKLVMRCILVCTAETQRALHVRSIAESPPLWTNTARHSLSVTLQHMILTPTALLISLFMNTVAHKEDISSRCSDCAQRP